MGERSKKSLLGGIQRDGGGMLRINPSDAFSVLLTFSPSLKRRVVCQRAFIKLNQRGNNMKPPPDSLSEKVSHPLGGWARGASRGGRLTQRGTSGSPLRSSRTALMGAGLLWLSQVVISWSRSPLMAESGRGNSSPPSPCSLCGSPDGKLHIKPLVAPTREPFAPFSPLCALSFR